MAASGGSLGNFWVEISAKGIEATKTAVAGLEKQAVKAAESIGVAFNQAFKTASVAIAGLATAGLVGTQEGNRMALAWQQLSRQIAAVALPVFEAVTKQVEKLTGWMQSLSGAQQDSILAWGGMAVSIGMVASGIGVIPGLILGAISAWELLKGSMTGNLLSGLGDSFKGLFDALKSLFNALKPLFEIVIGTLTFGLNTILVVVNVVVKAVSFAVDMIAKSIEFLKGALEFIRQMNPFGYTQGVTETTKNLPGHEKGGRRDVHQQAGGFEGITSTYGRLQAAANKQGAGTDYTEKTANNTEQMAAWLKDIKNTLHNSRPLVGA